MKKGLPHGFKAKSERLSESLRKDLGLSPTNPLLAEDLAEKLEINIFTLKDFAAPSEISIIRKSPYSFSALTLKNHQGKTVILHNEYHSKGRQQSNLMHELAHILCKHPLPEPEHLNGFPFPLRSYNQNHEKEAETLGGILQVTRKGLLWALNKKMSEADIAEYFTATKDMIRFRLNTSGVRRQLKKKAKIKSR